MRLDSIIGRVRPRPAVPLAAPGLNSFCLMCASWFFGRRLAHCTRCQAPIFRWVSTYDLKFFRRHSAYASRRSH